MRRRHLDITFVFSLCCSLVINSGMVEFVVLHTQAPKVVDLSTWHARPSAANMSSSAMAQVVPAPAPEPAFAPPPPKKTIEFDNREAFGENGGVGEALNSSPGEQPLQGLMGPQEQAFLGRARPSAGGGGGGNGGTGAAAMIGAASPTENALPRPKSPPTPKLSQTAKAQARQTQKPAEQTVQSEGVDASALKPSTLKQPGEEPAKPASVQASANPPSPELAVQVAQNSPGRPGQPGAPGPAGPDKSTSDPAPPSDKESDPFSETKSFKFVNGKVLARNGRWVKTVKPHFDQAAMIDAALMSNASVTFLATVDEQGNVIHVVRYRSSGSDNIDLPCEQALNQWRIEPSKDRNGRPVKDVVSVTFGLEG
jgi:hypothetical protein